MIVYRFLALVVRINMYRERRCQNQRVGARVIQIGSCTIEGQTSSSTAVEPPFYPCSASLRCNRGKLVVSAVARHVGEFD